MYPTCVDHPPLTAAERRDLKQQLLDERQRILTLLEEIDSKALNRRPDPDGADHDRASYALHHADYASDSQTLALALAQREVEARRLEEIELTLRRIDAKRYGKCRRCNANLGFERMKANPLAEYCVAHVQWLEAQADKNRR